MDRNDPNNLRGFTDHFAQGFVAPQISFWIENVFKLPEASSGLEKEYYDGMINAAHELLDKFSDPYSGHPSFPLHEVVINLEEVERLKGIIGDNYRYLKNKIDEKKSIESSFVKTDEEEKQLENLDTYLNHVIPKFLDSLDRSFFVPYDFLRQKEDPEGSSQGTEGIFLCHSSKDKDVVRHFRNLFEENGLRVWFDESEVLPGDSITRKIAKGMEKAKFVAIFISENLNLENMSQYVGWELSMAKVKDLEDEEGRLIPVMIGKKTEGLVLPQEIVDKNYADFRDKEKINSKDNEFQRILKKVKNATD